MMQRRGQEGVASAPATATHAERERERNAQGRNARSSPLLLPSAPAGPEEPGEGFYPESFVFRKQIFPGAFPK